MDRIIHNFVDIVVECGHQMTLSHFEGLHKDIVREAMSDEGSQQAVVAIVQEAVESGGWDGSIQFVMHELRQAWKKELLNKLVEDPDSLPQQIASM